MRKKLNRIFGLYVVFQFIHLQLFANATEQQSGNSWHSGGGEILEHAQNPWFITLSNQFAETIKYCVIKGEDFSQSQSYLAHVTKRVLDWWKMELSNAEFPQNYVRNSNGEERNIKVFLNTNWTYQATCDEHTDLRFQFGILTEEQKAKFDQHKINVQKYVALAIRTDYNKKLKGKGFIYVSPESGPLAMKTPNLIESPWTDDYGYYRLENVLIHELGHIYGLLHSGVADHLMASTFPEKMVTDNTYVYRSYMQRKVFFPPMNSVSSVESDYMDTMYKVEKEFFDIQDTFQKIRIEWNMNRFHFKVANQGDIQWQEIGGVDFKEQDRRYQQMVTVWLPPDQTLLNGVQSPNLLLSAQRVEIQRIGTFQFRPPRIGSRELLFQFSPDYVSIIGFKGTKIYPQLFPMFGAWLPYKNPGNSFKSMNFVEKKP